VAACAYDLAQLDLLFDPPNREAFSDEDADVARLRSDVVELEHQRVGLAAIHARVSLEVVVDELARYRSSFATGGCRLLAMNIASGAKVGLEAFFAPPLPPVLRVPAERPKRQLLFTPAALARPGLTV
jgi:hypothetical protein